MNRMVPRWMMRTLDGTFLPRYRFRSRMFASSSVGMGNDGLCHDETAPIVGRHFSSQLRGRQIIIVSRTSGSFPTVVSSCSFSSSSSSSPFDPSDRNTKPLKRSRRHKKQPFIPRKAAIQLTESARQVFRKLLEQPPRPEIIGIALNYDQSQTSEPRMVFSFQFVTSNDVGPDDEPVSLEVVPVTSSDHRDGGAASGSDTSNSTSDPSTTTKFIPKSPKDSWTDGLPKLYVKSNAFLKVLGATVDVDTDTMTPILYDKEGNRMDPNA